MDISEEELRTRYELLSDEELLELWCNNTLVDVAQKILAEELRGRGIFPQQPTTETAEEDHGEHADQRHTETWVTVARLTSGPEAHIVRARLDAEGIPAIVADEHLVTANWFLSNAVGGIRVRVPYYAAQSAHEIVTEIEAGKNEIPVENDATLRCPVCVSEDVTNSKRSWKVSFLVFYFLGIPIPYYAKEFRCCNCGHYWKEGGRIFRHRNRR